MRILHVIYDDLDNPWLGGGGAVRTQEIYSRIAAQGHRVVVLCGDFPGAQRRITRAGVVYRRLGAGRGYIASRLSFVAATARLIRRGGYDIVIEDVSPYSPVASPLWKPRSVPAVASVQNLSGSHATSKYGAAGWGPRLAERPLLALFDNFIAVSPGIAREIGTLLGPRENRRIEVIPNSFNPVFFEAGRVQHSDERYVLFLGRIDVYQKGLDRLLQAFELAAARLPGLRLVIAGGGTPAQEQKLRKIVDGSACEERVAVRGDLSAEEAATLMRGAYCLAMPSRYEAWPLTALEAGASGLAVAGSDITGVRDAAPPYPRAHGFLTREGDIMSLADTFIRLAGNPELRADAAARGREWAARFTWDALAARQLAFYMTVLGDTRAKKSTIGR